MLVRETQRSDWAELRRVRLNSLLDAPEAFGVTHAATLALSPSEWERRAGGQTPLKYFAAFDGPQAVGLAAGVPSQDSFELISMWVHPGHRGSSVAGDLVSAVVRHGLDAGHRRIILDVAVSNARAWRCYQRSGFVFTGQIAAMQGRQGSELHRMELRGPE